MLVMIHGYGGSPAELEPLRRQLGSRVPVITPTLLSHGGRPKAESADFDSYFDDLTAQLEGAAQAPFFILGYSLGGYFALSFASRYPERVRGLITIATQHSIDARALAHLQALLNPERLFGPGSERRDVVERRFGAPIDEERFARARAMYERLHRDPPLREKDFRALAAPALVISGEQDPLAPGSETRLLAGLLPNARLAMLPGRAHPIGNVPAGPVAREVLRFLRDVGGGGFDPGASVDLTDSLVTGGLAHPNLSVSISKTER